MDDDYDGWTFFIRVGDDEADFFLQREGKQSMRCNTTQQFNVLGTVQLLLLYKGWKEGSS